MTSTADAGGKKSALFGLVLVYLNNIHHPEHVFILAKLISSTLCQKSFLLDGDIRENTGHYGTEGASLGSRLCNSYCLLQIRFDTSITCKRLSEIL